MTKEHYIMQNENVRQAVENIKIAIVGLGYVGLPLSIEFAKKYSVIGFDIDSDRIRELQHGRDSTCEANLDDLSNVIKKKTDLDSIGLSFTSNKEILKSYNVFVVTVPTPVNQFKSPDLSFLIDASETIGSILKPMDLVIYESTVYPGCTEEECIPVLEKISGLRYNKDFFVGYSPERINPGDKINTLTKIKKVTSGSTPKVAKQVDSIYRSIITAGTHSASCIKVAEASKAIENAQRDINISFVNELSLIFDRIGIDTNEVIDAASTKWNFLRYKPGLVGGHCIGVDPYYLVHKAQELGYHPQVILSGRRVNDNMGSFIANKVVKLMIQKDLKIKGSNALILGITFKENCPDMRNTRVVDIYHELKSFGLNVDIYDPWVKPSEVKSNFGIIMLQELTFKRQYEAVIIAVAHDDFIKLDYVQLKQKNSVVFDTKACLNADFVDSRL